MFLYVWTKPAFIKGSPVDHTWVTSYDCRTSILVDISQVENLNENYWYCKGDFHSLGNFIGQNNYFSPYANCLVESNDKQENGTIFRYGIDGVCHQVSNQVLYRSQYSSKNQRVSKARGYKVSSVLYGTYGHRSAEWNNNKINCSVTSVISKPYSLFKSRIFSSSMKNIVNQSIINQLEINRKQLVMNIEEEAVSIIKPNETHYNRAMKLNEMINNYLVQVSEQLDNSELYFYIFGIDPFDEINIIDPELFSNDFNNIMNSK